MSFHHPQDRHRDRKEQVRQQYHEARERVSNAEVIAHHDQDGLDGVVRSESDEERKARLEQDIARRLDQAGKELKRERDVGTRNS